MRKSYLYHHHTWPELGETAKKQPVVVLPIGSVEDHGHHLPLDTGQLPHLEHLRGSRPNGPTAISC